MEDVLSSVETDERIRVMHTMMQGQVDIARAAADFSAKCFFSQVDRANRLEAELVRTRKRVSELTRKIEMMHGVYQHNFMG